MAKLTERYVQDAALDFLKNYYMDKYKLDKIYVKKEAIVFYKKKKGRADGFLAFKNKRERINTVSLEAKSHKTFKSLLTENKNLGFFGFGFLFLIISFVLIHIILNNYSWIGRWLIPIVSSIILAFLLLLVFQFNGWFERHGIIEQVRRYPADEHWIAFSKDVYNNYNNIKDNELIFRAKKYNIGILIISAKQKVEIVLDTKDININKDTNYLKYYSISKKCEEELSNYNWV